MQDQYKYLVCAQWLALGLLLFAGRPVVAGGGLILQDDVCIIQIDFYDAHFTAYQPDTRGNQEFCQVLPDTGETIFVLDYLHSSLKEVPVDFRIIRDFTGRGRYVRWEDLQDADEVAGHSVFYRPPEIEAGGSYRVQFDFLEKGDYVGIVTAAHPSNDNLYNAVFPFSVGATKLPYWILYLLAASLFVFLIRYAYISMSDTGLTD